MIKNLLPLLFAIVIIDNTLQAQCVLSSSIDTQSEVIACVNSCGCKEIIIPSGTIVNMNGDWNLTSLGNILITVEGLTSKLVFSGNGINADALYLTAGSSLIFKSTLNLAPILQSGGFGQVRIVHGSTEYKGLDFPFLILEGGINTNGPLPVEITDLNTESDHHTITINWSTVTEKNNDYFAVEKSYNGTDFFEIGKVDGNGTTNERIDYTFNDYELNDGVVYYRLKQVDYDGKYEYSDIIYEKLSFKENFKLYPNPVDDLLTIQLETLDSATSLYIKDVLGQTVFTTSLTTEVTEINTSSFRPGNYFVEIISKDLNKRIKIIKK